MSNEKNSDKTELTRPPQLHSQVNRSRNIMRYLAQLKINKNKNPEEK